MDRNQQYGPVNAFHGDVALRKESVDRNCRVSSPPPRQCVALRKESVDRNVVGSWRLAMNLLSLSARRAWIEIRIPALLL